MSVQRILDDLHRNSAEHRRLLIQLDDALNKRRRSRSPSPPRIATRKVESEKQVHISRIGSNLPIDEIIDQFVEMYGAIKEIHRCNTWVNIEFFTTESQRKCLEDSGFLDKQWGIQVAKRIIKR